MITVEEIKARFPNPTASPEFPEEVSPDSYSVDGAFILFVKGLSSEEAGEDDRFPDEEKVAETLESVNSSWGGDNWSLTLDKAVVLYNLNDGGHFEKAWLLLERMLTWNGEDPSYLDI